MSFLCLRCRKISDDMSEMYTHRFIYFIPHPNNPIQTDKIICKSCDTALVNEYGRAEADKITCRALDVWNKRLWNNK